MGQIEALRKGQPEHLIFVFQRFVHNVHAEPAAVIACFFKLQELQLHRERRMFHFEGSRDFLVWDKLVDYPAEQVYAAIRARGLKQVGAMPLAR